jgi:hypothetical protein
MRVLLAEAQPFIEKNKSNEDNLLREAAQVNRYFMHFIFFRTRSALSRLGYCTHLSCTPPEGSCGHLLAANVQIRRALLLSL